MGSTSTSMGNTSTLMGNTYPLWSQCGNQKNPKWKYLYINGKYRYIKGKYISTMESVWEPEKFQNGNTSTLMENTYPVWKSAWE